MAYDLSFVFMTVAISGLPLAISKLVSELNEEHDDHGITQVLKVTLIASACLGLLISVVLFLVAPALTSYSLKDPRALLSLRYMAPALFFIFMMAPLRGYFQGLQLMIPRALSDTIEQIARVLAIIVLVLWWRSGGIEFAAAGAALGISMGAAVAFAYLIWSYLRHRDRPDSIPANQQSNVEILLRVTRLAFPIIMGSLIWPLMRFADTLIIHSRLMTAGLSANRATELFGQFSGQAGPVINLPSILTVALAASLVPSISASVRRENFPLLQSQTNLALKISLIIGLPATVGLFLLGTPVATLLYGNPEAGAVIAAYAWTILFLLLYQTSTAILQGAGVLILPVVSMVLGVITKAGLTWWLCALPTIHVLGAGWGTAIGICLTTVINLFSLYRRFHLKPDLRGLVVAPIIATLIMAGAILLGYPLLDSMFSGYIAISLSGIILIAGLLYLSILMVCGCFSREELLSIPRLGKWFVALLVILKIWKEEVE